MEESAFVLSKIERVIVTGAACLLVFLLGWVFHNFDNRLAEQGATMQKMVVQQAVTNEQLMTQNQLLSNVPGLTQKAAEMRIQIDRNTQDIKDLQSVKGLRR